MSIDPMPQSISLSLIVPAYNEEELIEKAVSTNLKILGESGIDFEVIVIDDGSTDNTLNIVEEHFSNHERVFVVSKRLNEGLGSAILKGVEVASKSNITFMPTDSPLSKSVLKSFIENIDCADILIGYRTNRKGYTTRMKFNSKVYHWLISNLYNLNLKDYNWVHLYKKSIFQNGHIEISSKGIFMLAEILIKANWAGHSFYEFPVEYTERESGVPTASSWKAAFKTVRDTLGFYYNFVILNDKKRYVELKTKQA